jgi:hypothetical protein
MEEERGTQRRLGCIIVIIGTIIVWGIIGYLFTTL